MTLKKTVFSAALLACITTASPNVFAAPSAEVTLQSILTNSTCDVSINGGKSVLNVGVFNTKVGGTDASFTAPNTVTTQQVNMPVTLTGCAKAEKGELIIQGITSVKNNEQNLFVAQDNQSTGFMIQDSKGKTISNGNGAEVSLGDEATNAAYTFKVGMGTTSTTPEVGSYSAPILVSYIVN